MSHLYLENYEQAVKLKGVQTKKPISTASTLFVGGVATFAVAPVFNGGTTRRVISGSGATVSLISGQSGSLILMDRAAGIVFTLPAAVVGLTFDFYTSVTVTSNSFKVITNTPASEFIAGSTLLSSDNLASKSFIGNGTTHVAVTQAAASTNATGGIIGSYLRLTCLTTGLWSAQGMLIASATPTTPFATS